MPLRRFRRQYEQLSQFERGKIIGMKEARRSASRVARQLGCSDCVVRRCWDQWIRKMSFTRRPGSGRPRQTSRREDHHINIFVKKEFEEGKKLYSEIAKGEVCEKPVEEFR
ncbi:uncharacterized protein TNCV_4900951 [Trichonephila clavipes]|nr:uncharacterized protein TNCV_4900951 [Trichonephila clavipes]